MGGPLGWLTGPGAHPGWGPIVTASIGRTPGCPRAAWSSGPACRMIGRYSEQRARSRGGRCRCRACSRLARACGARRDRARPRRRAGRGATASHNDRRSGQPSATSGGSGEPGPVRSHGAVLSSLRLPAVHDSAPDAPGCTANRERTAARTRARVCARGDRCACPAFTVPARGHNDPPALPQPARASARLDGEGLPGLPPAAPIMAWSFASASPAEAAGLSSAVARHHGVLVLARARDPRAGPAVLADNQTTCLAQYLEHGNARSDTRPGPDRFRGGMPFAGPATPGCSRQWLTGLPPADTAVLIAAPPHPVGIGEFANAVISASARAATGCGFRCVSWVKNACWPGRTTRSCQNRSPSCGTLAMRRAWASSTGTPAA
jgi:hypothetical protein